MTDITEMPYAEDFAAELCELVEEYQRRGLSNEWIIELLKSQIDEMGPSHD